ncbi:MAG: PaaI family thioesterase [Parvibaculaceae bacterium]
MGDKLQPVMTVEELTSFFAEAFPQASGGEGEGPFIEAISPGMVRIRRKVSEANLRPGGTVSGPTMMAMADHAMYAVILGHIGPVALAVTTNLNINFLRKPDLSDLIAEARLLKLGKRLAVGEVTLFSEGREDEPVAHVTSTYSIPPDR